MSEKLGDVDLSDYKYLSSETKSLIEQETKRLLYEARQRATKILLDKRKELDLIAQALVDYETLSADELKKVIRGEKLDKMKISPTAGIKVPEPAYSGPTLEGGPASPGGIGPGQIPPVPGVRKESGENV